MPTPVPTPEPTPVPTPTAPIDADDDGANQDVDCDDSNADIYPGATEHCNGEDDDCDESVDEAIPPWIDTSVTAITPNPDVDLIVAREQFYPFLDLTDEGYGVYENVQSIFTRTYRGTGGSNWSYNVRFDVSGGAEVLEVILSTTNDPVDTLVVFDEVFGIIPAAGYATTPDDNRDVDAVGGDLYTVGSTFVTRSGGIGTQSDDLRILIGYPQGSSCDTKLTITFSGSGETSLTGVLMGDRTGSDGVEGSGDLGEGTLITTSLGPLQPVH